MRTKQLLVAFLVPALLVLAGCTRFGASLTRPEDPVVLDGAHVPKLLGSDPATIVAFAWNKQGWHPIPVQVDERDLVNPNVVLHRSGTVTVAGTSTPFDVLTYTQPQATLANLGYSWTPTYVGVDSDPTVDANDEVSFLANDSGLVADGSVTRPAGVDAASETTVTLTDPIANGQTGTVYLFRATTASPAAGGTTGVRYTFSLDSGGYRATYGMGANALAPNNRRGPNPEHSTVVTPSYTLGFSDRWLNDTLRITAGGADGTDILERGRAQFPGTCGRSEDTFDDVVQSSPYEAGFSANISGPVRAVRAHVGANSGQYTTMTQLFYPQRADETVDLRVHAIPGVVVFDDLQTGVAGLTYADDLAPNGVTVDGATDSLPAGLPTWQMITSAGKGSYVTVRSITTDIAGLTPTRFYLDQNPASPAPCTGDAAAWGQFGVAIPNALPCTDPTICTSASTLASTRIRYFEPSQLSAAAAATLRDRALQPIVATVS